jgi:serine protease
VLFNHQEFGGRVNPVQNMVSVGTPPAAGDCNGHGTHCAGSAAGAWRGVATGAAIGSVRVLNCQGSGTNADVVAGFNFVANNQASGVTNILSASLGGGKSTATDDAINAGANRGVVPVVAAGNDNNANACNYSPAGAAQALTVGATASNDGRASFSNSGSCLDVFSPGVSIHSAWYTGNTAYNTISGTSMATPLTAGAIALYASIGSTPVTRSQVKSALNTFSYPNKVTGTLLSGTPNLFINARWA